MTKVEVEDQIAAPLERIWGIVSDFTGMIAAMGVPFTSEGEGIGMTRTVHLPGAEVTERLEQVDPATHTTSYSIVASSLPLSGYQAWIALSEAGPGSTAIRWWGSFEPDGTDEESADHMVRGIYLAGIARLKEIVAQ